MKKYLPLVIFEKVKGATKVDLYTNLKDFTFPSELIFGSKNLDIKHFSENDKDLLIKETKENRHLKNFMSDEEMYNWLANLNFEQEYHFEWEETGEDRDSPTVCQISKD